MTYSCFLETVHKRLYPTIMLPSSASLSSSLTNPSIVSPLFIVAGFSPPPSCMPLSKQLLLRSMHSSIPCCVLFFVPHFYFFPVLFVASMHLSLILSLYLSLSVAAAAAPALPVAASLFCS